MAVNKHGQDDAAIPALVGIKPVLGQLDKYGMEGVDWEALVAALEAAQELGCASADEVTRAKDKTLDRDSLLRISKCVDGKWSGGAGTPYKTPARTGGRAMTNPSWWDRAKEKAKSVLNSEIEAHPGRDLVLLVLAVISAFSCAISVCFVYHAKTLGSSASIYLAILSFGLIGTQAFIGACRSLKLHYLWVMIAAVASILLTVMGLWADGTLFN